MKRTSPRRSRPANVAVAPPKPPVQLLALGLVVLATLAHGRSVMNQFIWDDDFYVTDNKTLRSLDGLRQIVDALRDETLTGVEQPVSQPVAGDEPAAAASPPETAGQPAETAGEQPVAEVAAEPRAAVAE